MNNIYTIIYTKMSNNLFDQYIELLNRASRSSNDAERNYACRSSKQNL